MSHRPFQNVLVAGPGALGTVFAVHLEKAGHTVILLDHDSERGHRLRNTGLRLRVGRQTLHAEPQVLTPADPLTEADLVLVTVKAHSLGKLGQWLADLQDSAVILTLQNGLGVVEALVEGLGHAAARHRIIQAVTYQAASPDDDGIIRQVANLVTRIDGRREYLPIATAVAHVLELAGLPAEIDDNIAATVWNKLVANVAINPLSALAGVRNGELLQRAPLARQMAALAQEAAAVARAEGIDISDEQAVALATEAARATAGNISSMRQDVERGRPTEIDFLNGAIVRLAAQHELDAPENKKIADQIAAIAPL